MEAIKRLPETPTILHTRVVTGTGGGPEKTILNSGRFLPEYRTLCAYMHPPEDPGFEVITARAEAANAQVISIPDRGLRDFGPYRQMVELCKRENVQIWHAHDYKSNLLGLLVRRRHPMRLLTTVHGWVKQTWKTPLYYGIDRWCLKRYERVLCVSEDLFERCKGLGCDAVYIQNGIDTNEYVRTQSREEARQHFGLDPDRLLIGSIGRLSEEKCFNELIAAIENLINEGVQVDLVIAGEGDQMTNLQAQIDRSGHSNQMRLLGFCKEIQLLLECLDIFVLPSKREGLPNALLEAMALELPVIATAVCGIPSLIQDGHNGILVQPEQSSEIEKAVRGLLSEPERNVPLGKNARKTIERDYSFANRMNRIRTIYDETMRPKA